MLIMMLLMISLMAVVCAFLIRGVVNFYENEFYEKMQSVFSMPEFVSDLRAAAGEENGPDRMDEILSAYSGALGVDGTTRTYSVLDGGTGAVLVGPDSGEATPNIITALTGAPASARNASAAYMDVAVPITNGDSEYIVYVRDNKAKAGELNRRIFLIIMEALLVGLVISVVLSFLLHEFGHKFMAQRYGLWSEFRMWPLGLALTMVSSFLGFMFASPGAVMIAGNVDSARNGKISIAGPAVNIVIGAIAIAGCLLCNHSGWVVLFMMLANLNSFLALFNLLPIPPLDGSKIISWNLAVWIVAIAIAAAEVLYIWQYMPTLYWG